MERKTGALIVTKAADVGLDVAAIKGLMEARGIDTNIIAPEVAAERFFRMVASTEDVDHGGDVVKAEGWDFSTWLENPALFADHKQTLEGTVARGLQAFVDTTQKCAVVDGFFLPPELDKSGLAEFVRGLYAAGMAKGVSIGAIPVKSRWATKADTDAYGEGVRRVWDKTKLLEVSFVGIPMNSQAMVARVAKSVVDGSLSADLVEGVAGTEGEFGTMAKAALYVVKSANPPAKEPDPPAPAVTNITNVVEMPPEVKALLETMQSQIEEQGRALKRMNAATKSEDVAHVSVLRIERVLELLSAAVDELAEVLPQAKNDTEDPPTQDDAVQVDACKNHKSEDDAPQLQRLAEVVGKYHTNR